MRRSLSLLRSGQSSGLAVRSLMHWQIVMQEEEAWWMVPWRVVGGHRVLMSYFITLTQCAPFRLFLRVRECTTNWVRHTSDILHFLLLGVDGVSHSVRHALHAGLLHLKQHGAQHL